MHKGLLFPYAKEFMTRSLFKISCLFTKIEAYALACIA